MLKYLYILFNNVYILYLLDSILLYEVYNGLNAISPTLHSFGINVYANDYWLAQWILLRV